jgi:hypothetical protein
MKLLIRRFIVVIIIIIIIIHVKCITCHYVMTDRGDDLQLRKVLTIILVTSRRQPTRSGPPALKLDVGLTTEHNTMNTSQNIIQEQTGWEGVDWICLAEDTDQWRAVVAKVMNVRVPQNAGDLFCSSG